MSATFIGREYHDPDATVDYSIDWSCYLAAGDTISAAEWASTPTGLTVEGSSFTDSTATARVSGGEIGVAYTLTSRVTLASGQVDDRSIILTCVSR